MTYVVQPGGNVKLADKAHHSPKNKSAGFEAGRFEGASVLLRVFSSRPLAVTERAPLAWVVAITARALGVRGRGRHPDWLGLRLRRGRLRLGRISGHGSAHDRTGGTAD